MTPTVRVVDPATGNELLNVQIDPMGFILTNLDLGFPTSRAVTVNLAGADGELDTTAYFGGRTITTEFTLMHDDLLVDAALDTLKSLTYPGLRLYLYIQRDGWPDERRILVRGDTYAETAIPGPVVQMTWHAADAFFEDSTVSTASLSPIGSGEGGVSSPLASPFFFTPGVVPGYALVTVGGTAPVAPIIDLYGPCTGPAIELVDTGQQIIFPGLTIQAGQFVSVDMRNRTAYLNNQTSSSVYSQIDSTQSSWWTMSPGSRQIMYSPSVAGNGCQAILTWRNKTI